MPDFEKLLVILTIDNAQMLRINPELLEMCQNNKHDEQHTNNQVVIILEVKNKYCKTS